MMRNIIHNFFKSSNQQKNNRNRAVLEQLQALGFSLPAIRKALLQINGVSVKKLAGLDGVSEQTLYSAIRGIRANPQARKILAGALGLRPEELFPQ